MRFQESFKFLSGNCEQIRLRQNYTLVEAIEPTSNFVYFARSLTYGKRFCVSVAKLLDERSSDFSFVVGFTTCSPISLLNDLRHSTEQCTPSGCGSHSQQVKIFKASQIGSKVTFERQTNGEIYFAIDSAMPIHIQFDRKSCDINLAKHEHLTPYIQLSGNVLTLTTETNNIRQLNIESAIAVRRGQPLGTATAFGPPIHKRYPKSQILPKTVPGQAHQAFVASSDVDTKFIDLNYPDNDVKVSINRMAVLRKNEQGERFFFYLNKKLTMNAHVTVQVTKIYNADKYTSGFEFGVTTSRSDQRQFLSDYERVRASSHFLKIRRDVEVNDKLSFRRTDCGAIEVRTNGVVQIVSRMDREFSRTENLLPFIILNGTVSGIIINNTTSNAVMEFGQMYDWPPVEFKMTTNVALTNQTLLTWSQNGKDGVIVNAKLFDNVLKFIIREVRTSINAHSMTFGLINSTSIGFKTPREMSTCLDLQHDNLIRSPALGLKFSLYRTPYGKVTLKYDDGQSDALTLFMVDPSQCYYPVFILNGSVAAIELLPNPSKNTVKYVVASSTVTTSRPLQPNPPTNDCKICMDRPINSVFVPCGHRFACHDCAKLWMLNGSNVACPVCRKKIDNLVQTFD